MKQTKTQGFVIILIFLLGIYSTRINTYRVKTIESDSMEMEIIDVIDEEVLNFSSFYQTENDQALTSSNSDDKIDFSYFGGSSSSSATDEYQFQIEKPSSHFFMEITLDYNYTGITLGEFYVRLEGDYAEDGSIADTEWEHRILQCILFDVSDVEGPDCKIIGHPSDGYEEYNTTEGTVYTNYFMVIRILRNDEGLLCEMDSTPDYYLNHNWSSNLTKPLGSISIGGTIFPIDDSSIDISFNQIYAMFTHTELPHITPNGNQNETMPFWFWIIIGGAFSVAIALPIVINIIMKKKVQKT
ncbi:MAG: hypothetical protein FK732_10905 [Asgard group archaeon]|nr:hypothetical protein [Asgard group archaeon]